MQVVAWMHCKAFAIAGTPEKKDQRLVHSLSIRLPLPPIWLGLLFICLTHFIRMTHIMCYKQEEDLYMLYPAKLNTASDTSCNRFLVRQHN